MLVDYRHTPSSLEDPPGQRGRSGSDLAILACKSLCQFTAWLDIHRTYNHGALDGDKYVPAGTAKGTGDQSAGSGPVVELVM